MFIEYFYNDHGWSPNILEWNGEYDKEEIIHYLENYSLVPVWSERYLPDRIKLKVLENPPLAYLLEQCDQSRERAKIESDRVLYLINLVSKHPDFNKGN